MEIILLSSKKQKSNPFQPGYGVMPPVLAGRSRLKQNFRDRLASIQKRECNPTAIILVGPRGCGKTALLEWVGREAKSRKLKVVNLVKENFTNLTVLQHALNNQASPAGRSRKISVQGRLGEGEASAGIQAEYTHSSSPGTAPVQFLGKLLDIISRKGLILLVDEAHDMPPEIGKNFYDAAQTIGRSQPLLLVIAGTPDLKTVLQESHATFSERAQIERIGRLKREEARQALTEPFDSGISFHTEALGTVLAEAQDYPYFIQLWGRALWDVLASSPTHKSTNYRVRVEDVAVARDQTVQARWELYSNRVQELSNNNLLVPLAEMAIRLGEEGQPNDFDFELAIHHLATSAPSTMTYELGSPARLEAQQTLLHTGFIWEREIGQWEYGIPSLATHIREEGVRVVLKTLQGQGTVQALKAVADCFGSPTNQSMFIETHVLQAALDRKQLGADDPLAGFLEMKLLIPARTPSTVRLMAPHLVQAIVAEAKRQNLLPDPGPPARKAEPS